MIPAFLREYYQAGDPHPTPLTAMDYSLVQLVDRLSAESSRNGWQIAFHAMFGWTARCGLLRLT